MLDGQVSIPLLIIHSPHSNGFNNNPVYWADPSGATVEQIEGGTRYTGEDAKVAFLNLRASYNSNSDGSETDPDTDPPKETFGAMLRGWWSSLWGGGRDDVETIS